MDASFYKELRLENLIIKDRSIRLKKSLQEVTYHEPWKDFIVLLNKYKYTFA